jgi:hypothetical protein
VLGPLARWALVYATGPVAGRRATGQWPSGSRISKALWDLQGFVSLQAQVVIGPENQGGLRDGRGSKALAVKGIGSYEPPLQLWLSERDCSDRVVLGNHPMSVRHT